MIRMVDFFCRKCAHVNHDEVIIVEDGERGHPRHCGKTMAKMPAAPRLAYKPHYSHALGRNVETWSEEEKALEKKGQWIASPAEANRALEEPVFDDGVAVKRKTEADIKKHVEKVAKKLTADGVISLPD